MSANYSDVVTTAREYYNSDDADNFYFHIWGGEDIHIGIYQSEDDDIRVASERTVAAIGKRLKGLGPEHRVIDLGAGYGGAGRWLARTYGCHVTCLNLSEAQNRRNREISEQQGLSHLVDDIDEVAESLLFRDLAIAPVLGLAEVQTGDMTAVGTRQPAARAAVTGPQIDDPMLRPQALEALAYGGHGAFR